jgi:hypothetical protein
MFLTIEVLVKLPLEQLAIRIEAIAAIPEKE